MPQQAPLQGFDLDTSYTIRTPRRTTGFAAQLWGQRGYWDIGIFPAAYEARRAARQFACTDPPEPSTGQMVPPGWHWRRSQSHAPDDCFKFGADRGRAWARRVKGNAWQSRPWVSGFGNINLGLFTATEYGDAAQNRAVRVSKAFDAEWQGTRTVAQAVAALKRRPANSWERVRPAIEVPEGARELLRPVGVNRTAERARNVAERLAVNLFGEATDPEQLLDGWGEIEGRREEYARAFQDALLEGEPFEEAVSILSP
jgi:hypothetical protein